MPTSSKLDEVPSNNSNDGSIELPAGGTKSWRSAISFRGRDQQHTVVLADDNVRTLQLGDPVTEQTRTVDFNRPVYRKDRESAYVISRTHEFFAQATRPLEIRGVMFAALGGCSFIGGGVIVYAYLNSYLSQKMPEVHHDPYVFALIVLNSLSKVGLVLIVAKLLLAIGKASVHESIKNFERRHAMRFGQLYMELRGRDWKFNELEDAFQWNREGSSAFRDIDLKHVSDTTLNLLLARLNEIMKAGETKAAEKLGEKVGGGSETSAKD